VDLSHIRKSYVTIREAAIEVLDRLGEEGASARFRDLTAGRARGDRVVFFLALLELFKLGHVDLEQPDHRGPMSVARLPGGSDLESLTDDDEDDEDADDGEDGEDARAAEHAAATAEAERPATLAPTPSTPAPDLP
jgi:segregation and condensation protein A